ncbi:putative ATPase [Trypanosoma grayi]|uniref:putative ATPase n=1 Tax=Trypanosoma grayi TaxID=71804 RepID=UPI0004F43525|nr:putative ATPase [Trypanosoma grayi]KEG08398.1 putative ATPase [Trypanosoma grayi]
MSSFEFAEELLSGMLLYWPHRTKPVSLLLCGPHGNGKSHVVRTALQRAQDATQRRVFTFTPHLAQSLSRRHADGSTVLRNNIRRAIFSAASSADNAANNDNDKRDVAVAVVLDHMELFITATTDAAESMHNDDGQAPGQLHTTTPHHPALLADLYDIIRGRELCTEDELQQMNLSCVAFVTLFSGAYEDIDPFARAKLFDACVSLKTPAEAERLAFLQNQVSLIPTICRAMAARTGGITYRGLTEIVEHAEDIMTGVEFNELHQLFLHSSDNTDGVQRFQYSEMAKEALATTISLRAVRAFCASGTTAAKQFRQSAGYVDVQETHWHDISGLEEVKQTLQRLVLRPLQTYATYRRFGVRPSTGVLLCGLPGTGKTMLARAMATELNASFIYLDLPQLIQAEVGESEKILRGFFDTARERSPSVMFIDELQAAFGVRHDNSRRSRSSHDARLVSQLLHLLDVAQADDEHFTLFVGATNVRHMLDKALLRAGRLDTVVDVSLPDEAARHGLASRVVYGEWAAWFPAECQVDDSVRKTLTKALVDSTAGCSGAELRHAMNMFAFQFLRLVQVDARGGSAVPLHILNEFLTAQGTRKLGTHAQKALKRALSGTPRL